MSRLGPVITLAAGAVLAAGLGVASTTAAPAANTTAASTTNETSPAEPTEEPTGEPTDEATPTPAPTKTAPKTIGKADYAGYVKGNGGLIAISTRGGKTVAYFCDGKSEAWFKGKESDGKVTLKGFGEAAAAAQLGGGHAKGWLKVGGKKWTFNAATVVKPSGLYRASAQVRGAKIRAGWIVLKQPKGGFTQVGAAFADEKQLSIPKLDGERPTDPVTVDGATVEPKDVDGFIEEMQ